MNERTPTDRESDRDSDQNGGRFGDLERIVRKLDSQIAPPTLADGLAERVGRRIRRRQRRKISVAVAATLLLVAGLAWSLGFNPGRQAEIAVVPAGPVAENSDEPLTTHTDPSPDMHEETDAEAMWREYRQLQVELKQLKAIYLQAESARRQRESRHIAWMMDELERVELDERTAQSMLMARRPRESKPLTEAQMEAMRSVIDLFPDTLAANQARDWLSN